MLNTYRCARSDQVSRSSKLCTRVALGAMLAANYDSISKMILMESNEGSNDNHLHDDGSDAM